MGLKLEVLFLRLCRSGVLLAIDVVRVLARRGRHAERQGVDVDGGTMSSNCAAALADPAAECADADVDVVSADGPLASWKSTLWSLVNTSHPEADQHGVHGRP